MNELAYVSFDLRQFPFGLPLREFNDHRELRRMFDPDFNVKLMSRWDLVMVLRKQDDQCFVLHELGVGYVLNDFLVGVD